MTLYDNSELARTGTRKLPVDRTLLPGLKLHLESVFSS